MNMFEVGSSKKKAKIFIKHKQSRQFWDLNVNMLVKQFFLNFQISVQEHAHQILYLCFFKEQSFLVVEEVIFKNKTLHM